MRKGNAAVRKKNLWHDLKPGKANYTPLSPIVFLLRAAEIYPERVAVIHGEQRITYSQWLERARRLASALAKKGVRRGEVVSVMLPNIPSMLDAHYGVPMLGAVLNTINTRLDADTVAYILEQDRKSTRLNSSHLVISYAVFCLKKKTIGHLVSLRYAVIRM